MNTLKTINRLYRLKHISEPFVTFSNSLFYQCASLALHLFLLLLLNLGSGPSLYASASASETPQILNQIIVKYKDPSFSPLASKDVSVSNSQSSESTPSIKIQSIESKASEDSPTYKYTTVYPGRNDILIIEGENIQQLFQELKNDPKVESVEPNYTQQVFDISFERSDRPDDSDFNKQWALNNSNTANGADIDFLEALALSRENGPENPIIIGIADSTFASEHPDLINQLWVNEEEIPGNGIDDDNNGYIDDIHGFDFVNLNPDVIGEDDHGTHVAGICAAQKNNQVGISGAFPNVKFIALACSAGGRSLSTAAILRAENYLIQLKNRGYNIVAVNASYGSNQYSQIAFDSIENLSDNGILMCTASGNDGWNLDLEKDLNSNGVLDEGEDLNGNGVLEVSFPNSFDLPNIISVASMASNQVLASDSNYGQVEVDLAAPGVSIFSTLNLDYIQEVPDITLSNGTTVNAQMLENSTNITGENLTGTLVACGIGNTADFPDSVRGNIALIQRGELLFSDKVINAMNAGAIAVIIYNNTAEPNDGIRRWLLDGIPSAPWIPSFSISQADGNTILQALPLTATLRPYTESLDPNNVEYGYLSGTSMASPVVTAAVAFAAHNFPNESMTERRNRILNNVVLLDSLSDKVASGGVVNLRKIVDTDEDNLPDWWEMDHFNTLDNTNSQDSDNDGYTNREEFLNKTNPTLATDTPKFKTQLNIDELQITDNTLEFNFLANPGYQYNIQSSDSLDNTWETQATFSGDGTPVKTTINNYRPEGQSQSFYRLQVTE